MKSICCGYPIDEDVQICPACQDHTTPALCESCNEPLEEDEGEICQECLNAPDPNEHWRDYYADIARGLQN